MVILVGMVEKGPSASDISRKMSLIISQGPTKMEIFIPDTDKLVIIEDYNDALSESDGPLYVVMTHTLIKVHAETMTMVGYIQSGAYVPGSYLAK